MYNVCASNEQSYKYTHLPYFIATGTFFQRWWIEEVTTQIAEEVVMDFLANNHLLHIRTARYAR